MKKPTYAWRETYAHAVLETNHDLRFVQICETVAAIEQRRLSPVESEHERRELEKAWEGVRTLTSDRNMKFVC
jgi:hypothetical protein